MNTAKASTKKTRTRKTAPKKATVAKKAAPKKVEEKQAGGIVKMSFKERYKAIGDGNSCGDNLSKELSAFTKPDGKKVNMERVAEVAKANDIDLGRWSHLNAGQVRMNLGNVLRTKVRRDKESVKIGTKTIKAIAG